MSMYTYEALTSGGRRMTGTLEAASDSDAARLLENMGLEVREITEQKQRPPAGGIGRDEMLLFNQQLAAIANAGMPLAPALRQMVGDIRSRRLQQVIEQIADDLEAGTDVAEAFDRHRGQFPSMYGRIIEAGVKTGRLGEMLISLNRHLAVADRTRRIVVETLSYPMMVMVLALVIGLGLLTLVVPAFSDIYNDMGAGLPAAASWLIFASRGLWKLWVAAAVAVVAIVAGWLVLGVVPRGRTVREAVVFQLPILGRLVRMGALSRLADCLAVMVASGSPLAEAFRSAGSAVGSVHVQVDAYAIAAALERGEGLLDAAGDCRVVPEVMLYAMQLASQRNELAGQLAGLAETYRMQTHAGQGRLQAVLFPLAVLLVGVFIGGIVTALFLPLVTLLSAMGAM
jgi:type II secretory pathway component PulF